MPSAQLTSQLVRAATCPGHRTKVDFFDTCQKGFLLEVRELCRKLGDGVNQAADLISATASIPSLNFIPLTTFGNWF